MSRIPFCYRTVLGVVLALGVTCQAYGQGRTKAPAKAPTSFAVFQVGDDFEIADASSLPSIKDRAARDHTQALELWKKQRKDARANKQKFDEPKPRKSAVKQVGSTFPSKDAAEEFLRKRAAKRGRQSDKSEAIVVLQVGAAFELVPKSQVTAFKKRLTLRHKHDQADYNRARKAAAKAKQEFNGEKPRRPVVKAMGTFPDKAAAQEFVDKQSAGTPDKE